MPTNTIKVKYEDGAVTCLVYDPQGASHDVSEYFRDIGDTTTKTKVENAITFAPSAETGFLNTTILFKALGKDMEFKVTEKIIAQILALES